MVRGVPGDVSDPGDFVASINNYFIFLGERDIVWN